MYKHISVLLEESIENLNIKEDGVYVDCTMGGAGHSSEILKRLSTGHLYCFDQDEYAVTVGKEKLSKIGDNFTIINSNFVNIKDELNKLGVDKVDGILYDLGVSSFQFDIASRGFSYNNDAKLDMRMDTNGSLSAYDVINTYPERDLNYIFSRYGEIKYARRLTMFIMKARAVKPIETTLEFSELVKEATPYKYRKTSHPSKKAFQAIRIAVNDELGVLESSLKDAIDILDVDRRVVVISFHSLEDRIVKNIFKTASTFEAPEGLPLKANEMIADYELINRKVLLPSEEELLINKRAHSAKMRVIRRVKL